MKEAMKTGIDLIGITLQRVDGRGLYFLVTGAAIIYLLVRWMRRRRRGDSGRAHFGESLLAISSGILFLSFFLPPVAALAVLFMRKGDVYWRYLWLVPTGVLIACVATIIVTSAHRRWQNIFLAAVLLTALAFGGRNLYTAGIFKRAPSREKLPEMTLLTANAIEENIASTGNTYAKLAAPQLVSAELREVTSSATLFTGRLLSLRTIERTNPHWYRNLLVLYGAKADTEHKVVRSLKRQRCNYILMYSNVGCDPDLEKRGYVILYAGGSWNLWYNGDVLPKEE